MSRSAVLKIDILTDGKQSKAELSRTGRGFATFGKVAAAGAAVAAAAVIKLGVDSIQSASSVEQAFGATRSIFGKYAGDVIKAARGAASTVGLAQSEYANLANVLGAQLTNMGTSADKLAPKTSKLIGLGADLAATFGGTTADAVSAVSSLLKGERDPIERYGVSIKAADVAARLQARGLDKLTGKAKAQAEAQATLEILTKQTTKTHGAFRRESGTLAGQTQRLSAMWENAKATLGKGLLPVVTRAAEFFTGRVAPAVQRVAGQLRDNLGPMFLRVSGFITRTAVPALQSAYVWFRDKIAPAIRSALTPVLRGLSSAWSSVSGAIKRNMPALKTIFNVLKTVAEFVARHVAPIIGRVLGEAFKIVGNTIGGVIDTIGAFIEGIRTAVEWVQDLIDKVSNSAFGRAIGSVVGGLTGSAPSAVQAARRGGLAGINAAAGPAASGAAAAITVGGPTVVVRIGERELYAVVDDRVDLRERRLAARARAGVR